MTRFSSGAVFGLVLIGVFGACTLIDPLDDISGGAATTKDSGRKDGASASSSGSAGSSSSGAGDDDDIDASSSSGSTTSSSGSTFLCSGSKEIEPNDSGNGSQLASPMVCGAISNPGDIDHWFFKNNGTTSLTIAMKIDAARALSFSLQSGGSSNSGTTGQNIVTSVAAGATLVLQITTLTGELDEVPYRIAFVAN